MDMDRVCTVDRDRKSTRVRNENNLIEWTIILKKDGSLFVSHESITGHGGAGIVAGGERNKFLTLCHWRELRKRNYFPQGYK